jgi:hypothetical protein
MKNALIAGIAVVMVFLVLPTGLIAGMFGLLGTLAMDVKENGPDVPPVLEAIYRQVAADRAMDWTLLAAWDGAAYRFDLPIQTEGQIFDELVRNEEERRRRQAEEECRRLPPGSNCPEPEPIDEATLARYQKIAKQRWGLLLLHHVQGHADRLQAAGADNPETAFDRVLPEAQSHRAAELQIAYTVIEQIADDDHAIEVPGGEYSPPPGWTPAAGFAWPAIGTITSRFGMRISPIDGKPRLHAGIDIGIPTGTPLWAAKSGQVTRAGWDDVFGYVVIVNHGDGYESLYAHNSVLDVTEGALVTQGQILSHSGETGWAKGAHLHVEIHYNGTPVDPMLLLGR